MSDAETILADQCRLQARIVRERMPRWIAWIFVAGFFFSSLGLSVSIATYLDHREFSASAIGFALCFVLFGAALVQLVLPFRPQPRVVPYFPQELGPLGGETMAAFRRGRSLYLEMSALDARAAGLGVKPLSAFGFRYDHFGQEVEWHKAEDGLATVRALRAQAASADLQADLATLASLLQTAAEKRVPFSLVLRLQPKDNLQMVCTRETRQGSFW